MKKLVSLTAAALLSLTFSLPALAQKAPADCSKARNPQHCEAMQKARDTCKDKAAGVERRQCMKDNLPAPDCSKARNPQRCEAMLKAHEACKDKQGPEKKQCLRSQRQAAGK